MTDKTEPSTEQSNNLKAQLNQLNHLQDLLHEAIREERRQGPPDKDTLEQKINQVENELQAVSRKIDKAKTHIKRRKKEIQQWKEGFDRLEKTDKILELEQLQSEIAWRAKDIACKESEIAAMYITKTALSGEFENLKTKKIIFAKGYYKRDINEDPRIKAILAERDKLQGNIEKIEK